MRWLSQWMTGAILFAGSQWEAQAGPNDGGPQLWRNDAVIRWEDWSGELGHERSEREEWLENEIRRLDELRRGELLSDDENLLLAYRETVARLRSDLGALAEERWKNTREDRAEIGAVEDWVPWRSPTMVEQYLRGHAVAFSVKLQDKQLASQDRIRYELELYGLRRHLKHLWEDAVYYIPL